MKTKFALFFVALIIPFVSVAQVVTCNCADNLNQTIIKTEANYAGFITKVNKQTKPVYHDLVSALRAKASAITNRKQCFYIIKEYIRFFNDKHFSFTYSNQDDADREIISVNESAFKAAKANGPEGIWMSADSALTLGIKKFDGGVYKAIVLNAKDQNLKRGLVYFTLKPHKKGYLLKQYNVFNSTDMYAMQRGNLLQLWNFALFVRINRDAVTPAEKAELLTWKGNNRGLDFKMLDNETSYIRIPTFFNNDDAIAKLVSANDGSIRASKYFIIDLRSNGGGSAGWSNLLPYVMTNHISQDSTILRVSADNIKLKHAEMEYFVKNPIPAELKPYYTDEFMLRFKKAYDDMAVTKQDFIAIPSISIPMGQELKKPAKVALITDGLCGSSAEFFFYLMKQSKKTTRYGTPSVGMMDYEGPTAVTPLPCKEFILMIPIAKSAWTDSKPIDETGFIPDVVINKPYHQWVDYVRKDMKRR